MAKRRVNTKFLVIFTVIVVGGVLALLVVAGPLKPLIMRGDRVEKMMKAGDDAVTDSARQQDPRLKKEKLEVALRSYSQAAQAAPKDAGIWIKVGDTYNQLTRFDFRANIMNARSAWEKALETDPANLVALRRLLDSYYQELSLSRGGLATFKNIKDRATAINKLDPNDLKAASLIYVSDLHKWLSNIETDAADVEKAISELSALMVKDPANSDNVFYVAAAKGKRAAEARRAGQEQQAEVLFAESVNTFKDALRLQPDNAQMHYRFFVLLQVIRTENKEKDNRHGYTRMLEEAIKKARETAKPAEPKYVEMMIAAQQHELSRQQRAEAEKILLTMMRDDRLRKDQRVRLSLAKLYKSDPDKGKRDEALRLLQEPIEDIGWVGPEAWRRVGLEIETMVERANMYIDQFGQTPPDKRPALLKEIEQTYEQATQAMVRANQPGEDSRLLKVRGKIELLRGGPDAPIKAIQTFEKAQAQYRIENGNREDLDLMFLLARAYYASRQTGQARQLLDRFVYRVENFIPARVMLAELLIAEGEAGLAQPHVEYLEKNAPDLPDVIRLVLQTLNPDKPEQKAKVRTYFDKLPEDGYVEIMSKATVAQRPPVSNPDEAVRLYKKLLVQKPGDFEVLDAARQVLVASDKKDQAIALLEEGRKSAPNDERIALVLQQLRGATTEDIKKSSRALIEKTHANDEFAKHLKLYEFENVASGREVAIKHLEAAEKLKPADGRVLDMMFRHHVEHQNWDKANEYVEKLAKINWDQANGLVYRFKLAMVRGDRAAARRFADEMTQTLREFARSWVFSAQAKQADSQYESAIQDYQVALDRQAGNQDALLGIIACCYQLKRYSDAGRYIDKALKDHPSDPRFRQLYRDFQMTYGDPAKIFADAKMERDANPKDVNRWVALGRAYYAAARNKPADPAAAGHLHEAKKIFSEALKAFPGERIVWAHLVDLAEYNKDHASAEAGLRDMAKRPEFKDSPDPIVMLADYYLRNNKTAEAEAAMKQAVDQFKDNVDVRRKLAAFYTQKKDWPAALKLLDPASPDKGVRQQIVEIYMLAGQFPEAEKLLRGLLQTQQKDAQLHALLGVVLLNQGKREQALEAMNTSLDIDPRNATALYSRGQLRLTSKPPQVDDAIRDLSALRDVAPQHVEARTSLADAYKRKYRTVEATRELETALNLAPSRTDIRLALLELYTKGRSPNWADAERIVNDVIAAEPKDIPWRRVQAKMYSTRKKPVEATKAIREAILLQPTSADLIRDYFDILEAAKEWRQLETECNLVLNADANMAKSGWWVYLKRGIARRWLANKAEAMDDFLKAFEMTRADDRAGISEVQWHVIDKMAEHLDKEEAIRRADQLANRDPRWKVVLAYLHQNNDNRRKAMELIEEARLQMADLSVRDKITTLNFAGTIYMLNSEYDQARAAYEEVLKLRPDDLGAMNNIALFLAEYSNPRNTAKALEYSTQAYNMILNRNISDPNILDTHGWVHVLHGGPNVDIGIELLSDAIKAGDLPEAHYHLGEAMLLKKLPEDAMKSLARAQEILREREDRGQTRAQQLEASKLRQRIDEAVARAEKARAEARVSAP